LGVFERGYLSLSACESTVRFYFDSRHHAALPRIGGSGPGPDMRLAGREYPFDAAVSRRVAAIGGRNDGPAQGLSVLSAPQRGASSLRSNSARSRASDTVCNGSLRIGVTPAKA
jgi:hypothetical protein